MPVFKRFKDGHEILERECDCKGNKDEKNYIDAAKLRSGGSFS